MKVDIGPLLKGDDYFPTVNQGLGRMPSSPRLGCVHDRHHISKMSSIFNKPGGFIQKKTIVCCFLLLVFCPYPSKFAPKKSFPSLLTAGAGHFWNEANISLHHFGRPSRCTKISRPPGHEIMVENRGLWLWLTHPFEKNLQILIKNIQVE